LMIKSSAPAALTPDSILVFLNPDIAVQGPRIPVGDNVSFPLFLPRQHTVLSLVILLIVCVWH